MSVDNLFYARPESTPFELRLAPRLACWETSGHPDQVRLKEALTDAETLLESAFSTHTGPRSLRLDVGLPESVHLLGEHDLDNYAYPLATHLVKVTGKSWDSVWCTKRHGEKSFVRIGPAVPVLDPIRCAREIDVHTTASSSAVAYKQQIHEKLADLTELPDGPVSLQIAFLVGARRNWLNLWKPTIDALDVLLGRTQPHRPWHPKDGRITELGLHVSVDSHLVNDVHIAIRASTSSLP